MKVKKFLGLLIMASSLAACVAQTQLSDNQVAAKYPQLNEFKGELLKADEQNVDLLASNYYEEAEGLYQQAVEQAKSGSETVQATLGQANTQLNKALKNSDVARDELEGVLRARQRAIAANAEKKDKKGFDEAEKKLLSMGNMIAEGDLADVREERQALAKRYAKLEVDALKQATASDAEKKIEEAKRLGASDLAPKTLAQASSELKLAKNVLDSDADARVKAAGHAQNAYVQASRAIQITEIIKEFKQSRMTDEQMVIWYQERLAEVVEPVVVDPNFGQSNRALVKGLNQEIMAVVAQNEALKRDMAELQQQYSGQMTQLKQEYASEMAANAAERERKQEFEARFREVQDIFTNEEAEVYRQGNNVLIRSYGFNFPSGESEIRSENFPLLKKIINAIAQFPDSEIKVSGHTDNRGSDQLNMSLSEERAQKVAQFLVEVGNINDARVSGVGYGKTKPVASNETAEGREANRRVEVLIINK